MQRLLAILLLCTFSTWLAAPVFASPQSHLPSCCRRDGKHHCTQPGHNQNRPGLTAKCPCSPGVVTFGQHSQLYSTSGPSRLATLLVTDPVTASQTQPSRRTLLNRSHQKRGPPSLLS